VARILIVDDEMLVLYSMRMMLEAGGHQVDEAESGEGALALLRRGSYDVLVIDIVMPRKDGVETILDVRNQWPDLPILAISGGGPAGHLDRLDSARRFGADSTLEKPFAEDLINREIDALLHPLDSSAPMNGLNA
jgi:two-component system, chemotaxis family, chemotaxis protein CheY